MPVYEDDEWFNEYIDEIMVGKPIEKAFDLVYPYAVSDEDDFDDTDFIGCNLHDMKREQEEAERYSSIERMAAEEERWHGRSLDADLYYDADNADYSDFEEDFSYQIED